jgi:hypothetical protein
MANLTAEQQHVLGRILAVGRKVGATPKEIKAAVETGLVESNLRNLPGGDGDSAGWRQERASLYRNPTNLDASIHRFYQETAAVRDRYGTAGALAAAVQRPAAQFRGRYQQVAGQAGQLARGAGAGAGAAGGGGGGTPQLGLNLQALAGAATAAQAAARPQITVSAPAAPSFAAGVSTPAGYQAPSSSAAPVQASRFDLSEALKAVQNAATTGNPVKITGGGGGGAGRVAGTVDVPTGSGEVSHFDGKPVAGWIAPLLKYAQAKGWQGSVTSGYRTKGQQAAIYNSGVRPAAKPGTSNHEMTAYPGGAIDVSNAQQLSNILRRSKYAGLLQWAGAKDPVHFSHPHGGGY